GLPGVVRVGGGDFNARRAAHDFHCQLVDLDLVSVVDGPDVAGLDAKVPEFSVSHGAVLAIVVVGDAAHLVVDDALPRGQVAGFYRVAGALDVGQQLGAIGLPVPFFLLPVFGAEFRVDGHHARLVLDQ